MANHMRGEVKFPEGGEEVTLRCLPGDLLALSKTLGSGEKKASLNDLVSALENFDPEAIIEAIKAFGKKSGAPVKINVDAIDMTMAEMKARALDALLLGVHGQTYDEFIAEMLANLKKAHAGSEDSGDPLEGSED